MYNVYKACIQHLLFFFNNSCLGDSNYKHVCNTNTLKKKKKKVNNIELNWVILVE